MVAREGSGWLRGLLTFGVGLVALAIRWPYLVAIPRFTDELHEMRVALEIAQGGPLPLHNVSTFLGIILPYLQAALFRVFGPSPLVARAVVAVLGAVLAAVVAWWAWGIAEAEAKEARRESLPPLSAFFAALVAGAFVATSFTLVVINSHIAWSNSTTPLFTTAALAATWAAVVRGRPWWLVGAGFLWGLAFQTHPAAVPLAPGAIVWALWQPTGRAWLRTRWPWLALIAFAVGYSNMLWVILNTAGQPMQDANGARFGLPESLQAYGARLVALVTQLARMLVGSYVPVDGPDTPLWISPAAPVAGVLAVMALVWTARRSATSILPLVVITGGLILAASTPTLDLTRTFAALYDTRYLAPLLPLLYLALALIAAELWAAWPGWQRWVLGLGVAALIGVNTLALANFYRESEARQLTNTPLLALVEAVRVEATRGTVIILDKDASTIRTGGGGDSHDNFEDLMAFSVTPFEELRVDKIRYFLTYGDKPMLLLLGDKAEAELVAQYQLTPLAAKAPGYRLYLAQPGQKP